MAPRVSSAVVNNATVYLNAPDGSRMPLGNARERPFRSCTRELCVRAHKCTRAMFSQQERATPSLLFTSGNVEFHATYFGQRGGNVLGEVSVEFGRNAEFENSGATGARSNNSLDAPPRSLVTRTVRAFYSARGHSR